MSFNNGCCPPQQLCPVPCSLPLSCCPGMCPSRGNCCPSFWPPVVYQPPAQKICVIVNNCPAPKGCQKPGCRSPCQSEYHHQDNDRQQQSSCGQNVGACGQQNCGPQQQCQQAQFPPIHVEYINEGGYPNQQQRSC